MLDLIKDADILLFQHPPWPKIGWWISRISFGKYSHAGLAKWEDSELYCLEFREFRKSRKYKVKDYIAEKNIIDVFRVSPSVTKFKFDPVEYAVLKQVHVFDTVGRIGKILDRAEEMMGRDYSWSTIYNLILIYTPFIRWFRSFNEQEKNGYNFDCSAFISYLFRRYYIDPCAFLTDPYTKPSDLARSPLLNYLFTLD